MSRARVIFAVALLVALQTPRTSRASRVVVPDDVATVQLAIDGTADTVAVRPGLAPERVVAARRVVLEPAEPIGSPADPRPVLQSLELLAPEYQRCSASVRGLHLLGEIKIDYLDRGDTIRITSCVLDSGMIGPLQFAACEVRNCRVNGNIDIHTGYPTVVADTVANGTLKVWADGIHEIRDNLIVGPAPIGMDLSLQISAGTTENNVIRGVGIGLRLLASGYSTAHGNLIEDCTGHGIEVLDNTGLAKLRENTIRRCGGDGIHVDAEVSGGYIRGNVVEDVAGDGIRATATNSYGSSAPVYVDSNLVLRAGGEGIALNLPLTTVGNVVGRCAGAGMDLNVYAGPLIERNTVFSNGGAGMRLTGTTASFDDSTTVRQNLAALNVGPGFAWDASCTTTLDCNDWYANLGGATQGIAPGYTDLAVDPLFCDLPGNDVHLASASPLVNAAGCGLIGADSVGCALTADVGPVAAVTADAFRVSPQPTGSAVTFSWRPDEAQSIAVFDVTGALRWRATLQASRREFSWDGRGADGALLPAGVYLARLGIGRGAALSTRIVIVR